MPSVNYRQIQVADQETADDILAQLEAGADFAALATANSLIPDTVAGEAVWVPQGVLEDPDEAALFGAAGNEITTPPTATGTSAEFWHTRGGRTLKTHRIRTAISTRC